ncbi:type I polyketide synthase [Kitasatospora sp. NPDC058478]|uniref:type I polyketide synthase n=1 Tax=unclassified Kitasatospora TaxID=2633591 RepID=UPI0036672EFE
MNRDRSLDIAVTGMTGRFPGAADLAQLWQALRDGRVLTRRLSREELAARGVPASLADDPAYVPVHGPLDDADRFDHEFFGVSPREAGLTDPQHRLLLECAWAALEDAGHSVTAGDGLRTAVYAAASGSGHLRALLASGSLAPPEFEEALLVNERDFLATRIAYKLGLTGPALTVLTACSSSLVAAHLAVQALNNGECDQALVLAASANAPQAGHLPMAGGVMSLSGHCRPFDASADGTLGGSGALGVVLRRHEDVAGGPLPLHGVLLGSAVNNDGTAKAGFLAPSAAGQEQAIRAALAAADVDAASVGYLESHGTGTRVGDPIEWSAASAVYRSLGAAPGSIPVGALKATIGHLDAAAGLAGLVKALLVLRHGYVPALPGLSQANPLLEREDSPLSLPTEAGPWRGPQPRRAAVSSFGVGGTNVHMLVEQPPEPAAAPPAPPTGRERLVVLSAKDPRALARMRERLAAHLEDAEAAPSLADVGRTLARRAELPYRSSAVGASVAEVVAALRAPAEPAPEPATHPAPALLLFPGQGTQFPGMAAPFAAALPPFADALDACLAAFSPGLAREVDEALHDASFPAERLARTALAQPALFAVEYAAGTALLALGLVPCALLGHSLGEITAATLAGALALDTAARLVARRALLMQDCAPGAMVSLACGEAEARALLAETGAELGIAAVNAATSTVLAGPPAAVAAFRERIGGRYAAKVLRSSRAFHSPLIEPAAEALRGTPAAAEVRPAVLPWIENTEGQLLPEGSLTDPGHFARAARRPVRFADALATARAKFPDAVAVEVGPGRVLSGFAEAAGLPAIPLLGSSPPAPAAHAHAPAASTARPVLAAIGRLWCSGLPLDLSPLQAPGRSVPLPTYPFHGPRHPVPAAPAPGAPPGPPPGPPARAAVADAAEPVADTPVAILRALWAEQLGVTDVPDTADFFQLGGDSLTVARLARGMSRRFGVDVPVGELLRARSIGLQYALVERLIAQQILDEAGEELG